MPRVHSHETQYVRDIASRILSENEILNGKTHNYVDQLHTEKAVKSLLEMLEAAGYSLYIDKHRVRF